MGILEINLNSSGKIYKAGKEEWYVTRGGELRNVKSRSVKITDAMPLIHLLSLDFTEVT
jgi:hypothetical protein